LIGDLYGGDLCDDVYFDFDFDFDFVLAQTEGIDGFVGLAINFIKK